MLADGDSVARNAFRVGLRQDTPLPVSVAATQELDPSDILEVQDMAAAIARAEQIVAAPRSSRARLGAASADRTDMFEALGQVKRPTDDTAGPAVAAPPPTPVPPPPSVPRYVTIPTPAPPPVIATATEDDAYYQPSGRMRSLADVTLDGYRPEPTLLVRAASRRKRFSWLLLAALFPVLVLAAIAIFANADLASGSLGSAPAHRLRGPAAATNDKTRLTTTTATSKTVAKAASTSATAERVFDVNSLPTARARR